MSFVSFSFLILFSITFMGRFLTEQRGAKGPYLILLLAASLFFYASFVPSYLLILLFTTAVDFYAGRKIFESESKTVRKTYLVLSLTTNLGLLGFFKYADFLLGGLGRTAGIFNLNASAIPHLDLILPIGISFFTFESMSYTIDIYHGQLKPVQSYWRFLLFVSFFTHLVAGPIVRARELLYQFGRKRKIRLAVCFHGLYLMITGFFFKMVVADNLAAFVDANWIFGAQYHVAAVPLYLAGLFSCQIFADFFGYTNIAMGAAYLLGFKLPNNFNNPYISASFREFWTRWHMTLSRWIRDYLYVSLGGNRGSAIRKFFTLMATMLLAGLWHGAALTFLIWGGIHGLGLAVERLLGFQSKDAKRPLVLRFFWFFFVQGVVLTSWIFFRASDTSQAFAFLNNILQGGFDPSYVYPLFPALLFVLPVLLMHLGALFIENRWMAPPGAKEKAALCALMLYGVLTFYGKNNAFIYFQF